MKVSAPAKVNLYLEILGRRRDGYHEIKTLFQTVSLCDTLELNSRPASDPSISLKLDCSALKNGSRGTCPANNTNIVWRAAELFAQSFPMRQELRFTLKKQIPVQAGLGGGSSDAAAALLALATVQRPGKSRAGPRLSKIAAQLGADVPFFLNKGCALAAGIGEKITPIRPAPKFWAVIVKPPIGLSTREVYGWLDSARARKNSPTIHLTNTLYLNKIINLIKAGRSAREWCPYLYNRFETVVFEKVKELRAIKSRLLDEGAYNALLSGSGSAIYGIVPSRSAALKIQRKFDLKRGGVWIAHAL